MKAVLSRKGLEGEEGGIHDVASCVAVNFAYAEVDEVDSLRFFLESQ